MADQKLTIHVDVDEDHKPGMTKNGGTGSDCCLDLPFSCGRCHYVCV